MAADAPGDPGRGRRAPAEADQPRQGDVPGDRDDQGRGARLLRPRRRRPAPAPRRPSGDPGPLAARRRGPAVLREEPALGGAVVAAPGARSTTSPTRSCRGRRAHLPRQPQLPRAARPAVDRGRGRQRQNPNRLVIDLDPGKPAGLHECAQVALLRPRAAGRLGLELYPVTSGSKGMQLYAGLGGDLTSDEVRDLAQQLAQEMTKKHPDLVLWKMTKSLRPGKVFLDWSQNVAAKTTISPYSLRGRELPERRRAAHLGRGGARCGGARLPPAADVRRGARAGRARRRPPRRPALSRRGPRAGDPQPRHRPTTGPGATRVHDQDQPHSFRRATVRRVAGAVTRRGRRARRYGRPARGHRRRRGDRRRPPPPGRHGQRPGGAPVVDGGPLGGLPVGAGPLGPGRRPLSRAASTTSARPSSVPPRISASTTPTISKHLRNRVPKRFRAHFRGPSRRSPPWSGRLSPACGFAPIPWAPGAFDASGQGVDEAARRPRRSPARTARRRRLGLAPRGGPHVVDERVACPRPERATAGWKPSASGPATAR